MDNDDLDWGAGPGKPAPSAPTPAPTADSGDLDWGSGPGKAAPVPQQQQPKSIGIVEHGWALPVGWDAQGNAHLDSDAGVVGLAKRAAQGVWSGATLPGDVATGKVDPNSPEAIRRSLDMATLAAPDAAVATARKVLTPPTTDELYKVGGAGYDAVRDMGVYRSLPHSAEMAQSIKDGLNDAGLTPRSAQNVHGALDAFLGDISQAPQGAVGVNTSRIIGLRRELGKIAGNYNDPVQQGAAKSAQAAVDKFIMEPDPASVVGGDAVAAGRLFSDSNKNYAAAARSDALNQRGDYAKFKAADSNSGQNLPNNLRKQATYFLDPTHPARGAGFSDAELAALENVNRGDFKTNAARTLGSWTGAGHGMLAGAGIAGAGIEGAHAYGPAGFALGAVPPLIGMGAKALETRWTKGAFNNVDNMLRSRSPLYEQQQAAAPIETTATPKASLAARSGVANAAPAAVPEPPSAPSTRPAKRGDAAPRMTPEEAAAYVKSLPEGQTFAKGGAVKPKLKHEELVSRLMSACEKAKQETKKDTKALLNVPDNTVAHALEVAQKAI